MAGKRGDSTDNAIQHSADEQGGGGDAGARSLAGGERLTLGELTAAADVSVRTVRYYIAEGLLPPPEGSGPGSAYTSGHLDRLRLIQRLKEAYLPLKEIRRRLSGLSDDEVRSVLAADDDRGAGLPRLAGVSRAVPDGADGAPVSGDRRTGGGRSGRIRVHARASAEP